MDTTRLEIAKRLSEITIDVDIPLSREIAQKYAEALIEEYTEALASDEPSFSLKELLISFFEEALETQANEIKILKLAIINEVKVLKDDLGYIENVHRRRVILERLKPLEMVLKEE